VKIRPVGAEFCAAGQTWRC